MSSHENLPSLFRIMGKNMQIKASMIYSVKNKSKAEQAMSMRPYVVGWVQWVGQRE